MHSFDLMALLSDSALSHIPVNLNFHLALLQPELLHHIVRQEFIGVIFQWSVELIFVLYSALFYNSFSR